MYIRNYLVYSNRKLHVEAAGCSVYTNLSWELKYTYIKTNKCSVPFGQFRFIQHHLGKKAKCLRYVDTAETQCIFKKLHSLWLCQFQVLL